MLLPRRSYGKAWRRVLHDQTADRIVDIVSQLPHVNATIVPFHVAPGLTENQLTMDSVLEAIVPPAGPAVPPVPAPAEPMPDVRVPPGSQPISALRWRERARVAGRVKTVRVVPHSDVPTLECVLVDGSGEAITLVFLGRRSIGGLRSGSMLTADGMVGKHRSRLAMINPVFELLSSSDSGEDR
jgi:hypothetical protein